MTRVSKSRTTFNEICRLSASLPDDPAHHRGRDADAEVEGERRVLRSPGCARAQPHGLAVLPDRPGEPGRGRGRRVPRRIVGGRSRELRREHLPPPRLRLRRPERPTRVVPRAMHDGGSAGPLRGASGMRADRRGRAVPPSRGPSRGFGRFGVERGDGTFVDPRARASARRRQRSAHPESRPDVPRSVRARRRGRHRDDDRPAPGADVTDLRPLRAREAERRDGRSVRRGVRVGDEGQGGGPPRAPPRPPSARGREGAARDARVGRRNPRRAGRRLRSARSRGPASGSRARARRARTAPRFRATAKR